MLKYIAIPGLFALGLSLGCGGSQSSPAQTDSQGHPDESAPADGGKAKIERYAAKEADVNAYIVHDGRDAIIVDSTRSAAEGAEVAALVAATGAIPSALLITHGHPDHYLGMGAIKQAYPDIAIVVASQDIKADIIGFTAWMEEQGWLEAQPQMKRKTATNPSGFDYEQIAVLSQPKLTLAGGTELTVRSDYLPSEAEHMSTVHVDELNAVFTSDLSYNGVHLWLGVGVTHQHIENWKGILHQFESEFAGMTIYPGHGPPTDTSVFATNEAYMDDLLTVVAEADSAEAAVAEMARRYPDYKNVDFLLAMSVEFQRTQLGAE